MVSVKDEYDYNKYSLEFNGIPVAVEQRNEWDEDNKYYESYTLYINNEPVVLYDEYTNHVDWYIFKIPEGFDYDVFRKELKEEFEVELQTK